MFWQRYRECSPPNAYCTGPWLEILPCGKCTGEIEEDSNEYNYFYSFSDSYSDSSNSVALRNGKILFIIDVAFSGYSVQSICKKIRACFDSSYSYIFIIVIGTNETVVTAKLHRLTRLKTDFKLFKKYFT